MAQQWQKIKQNYLLFNRTKQKTKMSLNVTKTIWSLTKILKTYRGEKIASLTNGG